MLQLQINDCPEDDVALLTELLESLGALSVTFSDQYDNPILEPEPGAENLLWPYVLIHALYEDTCNKNEIKHAISQHYPNITYTIDTLPEQDWVRSCLADFKPMQFGNKLWVCPSWLTPPAPDAINLILDPGLAFGTGTHPTTGLCLTWLDSMDLSQKNVIDYGCGSGILAIAAIKLGAKHVYAVDIDEQALTATRSNALNNNVVVSTNDGKHISDGKQPSEEHQLTVCYPDELQKTVEVLIANILLAPLLKLKHRFRALLKDDGIFIASGVLTHQTSELVEAYSPEFTLISHEAEGEWAMLVFAPVVYNKQ